MANVQKGWVSRYAYDGQVIQTIAWADGVHTIEEMRAFVAAHVIPVERAEGQKYEQKFVIHADNTTTLTENDNV